MHAQLFTSSSILCCRMEGTSPETQRVSNDRSEVSLIFYLRNIRKYKTCMPKSINDLKV